MRAASWVVLTAGLFGCTGASAPPAPEAVTTLEASGIGVGLYAAVGDRGVTGEHATLLEILPDHRVRVVASSKDGKESACVAMGSVRTSGAGRTLSLRCAAAPLDFALVRVASDALELATARGERFTLAKVSAGQAEVRATCTSGGFAARLAVMPGAGRRRVVLTPLPHARPEAPPSLAPAALAALPRAVAVLKEGETGALVGRDLLADELDLTLPKGTLPARFDAALGVVDVMSPFAIHRESHPLSCVVDS